MTSFEKLMLDLMRRPSVPALFIDERRFGKTEGLKCGHDGCDYGKSDALGEGMSQHLHQNEHDDPSVDARSRWR